MIEEKRMKKEYAIKILIIIVIVLIFSAYYLFDLKNKNTLSSGVNSTNRDQTDEQAQLKITGSTDPTTSALIEKVFKHVFLPSGDVRVETVNKPELLREINPIFYQFVKKGDQILIFTDRAILYDPAADKVLDIIHATSTPFLLPTK